MGNYLIRAYLLSGLLAHKLLWEVMKRQERSSVRSSRKPLTPRVIVIKGVKLAILIGIAIQTLVPERWFGPLVVGATAEGTRLTGVLVYSVGLAVAIVGRVQLGGNWSDIETAEILESQRIVSSGIYRWIRHPIYAGDLLLLLGLELALNSWLFLAVVLLVPVVVRQAIREEKMLIDRLDGYQEYCNGSKRFVPFLF